MAFHYYNPNRKSNHVGDCVVRALSAFLDESWERIYAELCLEGFIMGDMPNSNSVWGAYLQNLGYKREIVPDTCPACYSIEQFAYDYPNGKYIVASGTHVVAIIFGDWWDSWDSRDEAIVYYWRNKE